MVDLRTPGRDLPQPQPVFDDATFGARTRALGARTDRQRCALAGISKATLRRWRRGGTPSLDALQRVAGRLGIGISDLLREAVAA
jgi:transcriptional regulator with XRE-family HTH domain